jgi:hypothetical protein
MRQVLPKVWVDSSLSICVLCQAQDSVKSKGDPSLACSRPHSVGGSQPVEARMRFVSIFSVVVLAVTAYGQSIVTPVFVHKDGEASMSGYAGSHKEIVVDGGGQQVVG